VQEHRWSTSTSIESGYDKMYSVDNKYVFIYTSAIKGQGGIGLLINKKYELAIKNISKISDRILTVNFYSNPTLTITVVYAPTETSEEKDKNLFYDSLEDHILTIPVHNMLFVTGDFNARIGYDSHLSTFFRDVIGRYTMHSMTNENGNKLVSLCSRLNLKPSQFLFSQPKNRQWTWISPNGLKTHIDHILIRNKWANSLINCRSYFTAQVGSDHRIVTAYIKTSLRCTKSNNIINNSPNINWTELVNNRSLQHRYPFFVETNNRFDVLNNLNENSSVQEDYNDFTNRFTEVNTKILSHREIKSRKSTNLQISDKSEFLKEKRDRARVTFLKNRNTVNHQKMVNTQTELLLTDCY